MDDKITFEDYGIEITDEELKNVGTDVLKICKERIEKTIKKIENKEEE